MKYLALFAVLVALAAAGGAMFDGPDHHAQPVAASWAGPDPDGWTWGED